tara:strand:- start:173 stop:1381 length:1209 start_codon:yes stop_codon:yes gene_type:complete
MAITLSTEASGINLAYQPVLYEFSSNHADIQSCVVEVLIDTVRVSATSVQPDLGTTNEFTFDASTECEKNTGFTLNTLGSNGVIATSTGLKDVKIKIYEVTLNPSTGLLVTAYDPDDANNSNSDKVSTTAIVYNWTENHLTTNSFDFTDYQLTANTKKFLTASPSVKKIELLQDEFIGILWYAGVASKNYKVEVLTYDVSNALLNTDFIAIADWNSAYVINPTDTYLDVGIGTQNLVGSGVSFTNVVYYTIQVINDDGDMSELKRFNIVKDCDTDTRVHWVNKFGKQDSYTFKGNKTASSSSKATSFTKAKGIVYDPNERGISTIRNITEDNFTAYSDSIGRETYDFLTGLKDNNMAWVEIDNTYFPITIDDGSVFITNELDMSIQFVLSYKFSNLNKGLIG